MIADQDIRVLTAGGVLVREGLAISETNYGDPYRREERQARERGRGIWQ